MTLQEFFEACAAEPTIPIFFFVALPLTALLASIFGKGEGHLSPWKYLYAVLIYLAFIPGLFAVTLNMYLFLFERQSVFEMDIVLQIVPILVMFLTFWLIKRNVAMNQIPGFGNLTGLVLMLMIFLGTLWILDRTHIFVISILPFQTFVLIFIVLLIAFRWGWKKLFESAQAT